MDEVGQLLRTNDPCVGSAWERSQRLMVISRFIWDIWRDQAKWAEIVASLQTLVKYGGTVTQLLQRLDSDFAQFFM
jgi:hypothetical protein